MNTHLTRGIAVLVLLIVSWLAVTYFVAMKVRGRRERRFTIRAGIAILLGILAFSALDYFVIKSSGAAVGVVLFFTLFILRRRQLVIRREEAANA
jgi:tellurite resistance protein TehA-like permease